MSIILNKLCFKDESIKFSFGLNLMKLELTLGLISKASGGTSNNIWVSKKQDSLIESFPQFFDPIFPDILSATSFCTKKCMSLIDSCQSINLKII